MIPLQDKDRMPWGKYKGRSMVDVPADYLFFLWTTLNKEHDMQCPVADYIRRNLASLEQDYPDGIWR